MKTKIDTNKIREIQQALSVKFEHEEITPQAKIVRLKALRLAKEASDKAKAIQQAAVEAARMAKPRP